MSAWAAEERRKVVVEVVSASAGVNQAAEEDPTGRDDFGSK